MSDLLEPPTEVQSHGNGKSLWINHGRAMGWGRKEGS